MRLLHSRTLDFKTFLEDELPRYLILSHTWGDDEVSYQDMCWLQKSKNIPKKLKDDPLYLALSGSLGGTALTEDQVKRRHGYEKIVRTAEITNSKGFNWFWIDTCCIDKSSSAELQEAINSMFRWYRKSEVCIVYLADATRTTEDMSSSIDNLAEHLSKSRWITRGWTLQELIAPPVVAFLDQTWKLICHKSQALLPIGEMTGIPPSVLQSGDPARSSVAQRMSWAANRRVTRVEDEAYCLLGIFDIHMPMVYGEGKKAFVRLQEEIMNLYADDSIFAWVSSAIGPSSFCGLLARTPSDFKDSGSVSRGKPVLMSKTNIGVRLHSCLRPSMSDSPLNFIATLQATNSDGKHIGLRLQRLDTLEHDSTPGQHHRKVSELSHQILDQQYARVGGNSLLAQDEIPEGNVTTVYVQQNPYTAWPSAGLSSSNLLLPIWTQLE